jgi:integrase
MTVTRESIGLFRSSLLAKGRAQNTLKAYETDLLVFLAEMGPAMPVDEYETRALFWLNLHREQLSPKTTSRRLTSVRAFARWAQVPVPDIAEYSSPTAPRSMPHPLPEGIAGVRAMIDSARFAHHKAYVSLCGLVGLRSSEALAIRTSHFDFGAMELTVRGKGDVTRIVPISDEAWDGLAGPVVAAAGSDASVVGLKDRFARRLVTDLGERAGITRRVASHDLRATFATAVYDKTKDIRLVQVLLGHANVNTTQLYIERSMDALREAVKL